MPEIPLTEILDTDTLDVANDTMNQNLRTFHTELEGIELTPGPEGPSPYEEWLSQGNTGTYAEFLAVLEGDPGPPGQGVPIGGTTGQVLKKASATDYATEWGPGLTQAQADKLAGVSSGAKEIAGIPGGAGYFLFDNVTVTTTPLISPDVRGVGGVPADAKGVFVQVNGGAQETPLQVRVDTAGFVGSTSPRFTLSATDPSNGNAPVSLGTEGKVALQMQSGTATRVYLWITGYWR